MPTTGDVAYVVRDDMITVAVLHAIDYEGGT